MKLAIGDEYEMKDPTAEDIAHALDDSPGGHAILSHDDLTYVQSSGGGGSFVLEYQDGSIDEHYRARDAPSGR